jgi:pimeloyl-ACP methyl ester carboxylesterase
MKQFFVMHYRFMMCRKRSRVCPRQGGSPVVASMTKRLPRWIISSLLLLSTGTHSAASQRVYLIHGFGSNPLSMAKLERSLRKDGFQTANYSYNSLYKDLDTLGKHLSREIAALHEDSVSFVTHSMGALVVRAMYRYIDSSSRFPTVNRIVMITPPNKGAEIADFFSSKKIISLILGPNLAKMRTDSGSYANQLPKPRFCEIGVIIAVIKRRPWYNRSIDKVNDGFLTPERATLGIEKEVAVVPASHVLVTMKRQVVKMVLRFMKRGTFKPSGLDWGSSLLLTMFPGL